MGHQQQQQSEISAKFGESFLFAFPSDARHANLYDANLGASMRRKVCTRTRVVGGSDGQIFRVNVTVRVRLRARARALFGNPHPHYDEDIHKNHKSHTSGRAKGRGEIYVFLEKCRRLICAGTGHDRIDGSRRIRRKPQAHYCVQATCLHQNPLKRQRFKLNRKTFQFSRLAFCAARPVGCVCSQLDA